MNKSLKSDLTVNQQQLVEIKPFSAANAATIVVLVMSIPAFCAIKFFQYFDPSPPPPISTGKALMLWAALLLALAVTYAFTALAALAFNASSKLTGGVTFKTKALALPPPTKTA